MCEAGDRAETVSHIRSGPRCPDKISISQNSIKNYFGITRTTFTVVHNTTKINKEHNTYDRPYDNFKLPKQQTYNIQKCITKIHYSTNTNSVQIFRNEKLVYNTILTVTCLFIGQQFQYTQIYYSFFATSILLFRTVENEKSFAPLRIILDIHLPPHKQRYRT